MAIEKTTWIFAKNIHLESVDETEKAYLVLVLWGPKVLEGRQLWIPKSVLIPTGKREETPTHLIIDAQIREWFMEALIREYNPLEVF